MAKIIGKHFKFVKSQVVIAGYNGHGSVNTMIRRGATVTRNVGSAITYADSATLGGSFTANEAGTFEIKYVDRKTTSAASIGISVNTTQPTTPISSSPTGMVSMITLASNQGGEYSATVQLAIGDVVRMHTEGDVDITDGRYGFSITKVRD